jgi:hypothetical protein
MLLFLICATITGQQYAKRDVLAIGYINIVFVWLHGVAYALAWSGLLVAYTVEILPYKLRAKGVFIMNLSVQVALTINNYVNPIPISEGGGWYGQNWKLFACYAGWVLLELIWIYYFYVETRYVAFHLYRIPCEPRLTDFSSGPTLEEIARIFDSDEAEVANINLDGKGLDNRPSSVKEANIQVEKL